MGCLAQLAIGVDSSASGQVFESPDAVIYPSSPASQRVFSCAIRSLSDSVRVIKLPPVDDWLGVKSRGEQFDERHIRPSASAESIAGAKDAEPIQDRQKERETRSRNKHG